MKNYAEVLKLYIAEYKDYMSNFANKIKECNDIATTMRNSSSYFKFAARISVYEEVLSFIEGGISKEMILVTANEEIVRLFGVSSYIKEEGRELMNREIVKIWVEVIKYLKVN